MIGPGAAQGSICTSDFGSVQSNRCGMTRIKGRLGLWWRRSACNPWLGVRNWIIRMTVAAFMALGFVYLITYAYILALGDSIAFDREDPSYSADEVDLFKGSTGERIAYKFKRHPDSRFTIVYSHGSAVDIGHLESLIELHRGAGFDVLAYDYPGIGLSRGEVSEEGVYRSLNDVVAFLEEKLGIEKKRMLLYGRSLGCAPTLKEYSTGGYAGAILVSPFLSTYRLLFPVKLFPGDRFDNLKIAERVTSEFLILHGDRDATIPIRHGRRLAAANRRSSFVPVRGRGHGDIHLSEECWRGIGRYLSGL